MFVFLAIIGLSVLVFFHELGHFLMAKILGIRVEEFGFGYPPRICGFVWLRRSKLSSFLKNHFAAISCFFIKNGFLKRHLAFNRVKFFWGKNIPSQAEKKTIYSLNWIPFGGFNKLKGELDGLEDKDSFFSQTWWKKALVGLGGVAMNITLAIFIFSFLYSTGISQDIDFIEENSRVLRPIGIQVSMVAPNSPADRQGLKMGDIIISIDGYSFKQVQEIQDYIKTKINQSLTIQIRRDKEIIARQVEVLPYNQVFTESVNQLLDEQEQNKINNPADETHGVIGVALSRAAIVVYPWHQAILMGFKATASLISQLFYGLWLIFKTFLLKRQMLGEFLGPVGITAMTAQVAHLGYVYFLQFIAFLSVAIGAFQIIPFPALDGSRVLFAIIQGIKGKPISHRIENTIISLGFYLLLGLLFFITFKEISGLF